jgi:hypothetical protein
MCRATFRGRHPQTFTIDDIGRLAEMKEAAD